MWVCTAAQAPASDCLKNNFLLPLTNVSLRRFGMNISGFGDQLLTGSALGINNLGLLLLTPLAPNLFDFHPFYANRIYPTVSKQGWQGTGAERDALWDNPHSCTHISICLLGVPWGPSPSQPTKTTVPVLPSLCDVVWAGFWRKRGAGRGIWTWLVGGVKVFVSQHSRPMLLLSPCKFKLKGTCGLAVVSNTEIHLLGVISVLRRWKGGALLRTCGVCGASSPPAPAVPWFL